jgi:hypothetical protein
MMSVSGSNGLLIGVRFIEDAVARICAISSDAATSAARCTACSRSIRSKSPRALLAPRIMSHSPVVVEVDRWATTWCAVQASHHDCALHAASSSPSR